MASADNTPSEVKLFYSYSHQDSGHRDEMEKTLRLLKNAGLTQWHDRRIVPGSELNLTIEQRMTEADIVVFLVSRDFLASDACTKEWERGQELREAGSARLISIIIRKCAWKDFSAMADYLVLPNDGKPITQFNDPDDGWHQIYLGIKEVIDDIKTSWTVRSDWAPESRGATVFIRQDNPDTELDDIFVFPLLSGSGATQPGYFDSVDKVIEQRHVLLHGDRLSGKSAFCQHTFDKLLHRSTPGLLVNLPEVQSRRPSESLYRQLFQQQFRGDFATWRAQGASTIIFDDLTDRQKALDHLLFAVEEFDNVIVTVASDTYYAYWGRRSSFGRFYNGAYLFVLTRQAGGANSEMVRYRR